MFATLICSLFGFLCTPGEAPGRAASEQRQLAARDLAPIVGRASVIDGDTIEIQGRRIRLQAIDAPESAQWCGEGDGRWRCGKASAEALDALADGATVTCRQDPRDPEDRYGRALARCEARGGDLGEALVRAGLAVAYGRYLDYRNGQPRPYKADMLAAEAEARAAKRGLWAGAFEMPWDWRAAKRAGRRE
jgi:endonuclease YncB( thermonuclease family)